MNEAKLYGKTIPEILEHIKQFNGKTLIFFDTETTGIRPHREYGQITQLAAMVVNGDDWNLMEVFNEKTQLSQNVSNVLQDEKLKAVIDLLMDPSVRLDFVTKVGKTSNFSAEIQKMLRSITNPVSREYLKDYIPEFKKYRTQYQKYKVKQAEYDVQVEKLKKLPNAEEEIAKLEKPAPPTPPKTIKDLLDMTDYYSGKDPKDRISEKQLLIDFENIIKKYGGNVILIAHNAAFDMETIQARRQANGLSKMPKYSVFDNLQFVRFFLIPLIVTLKDEEFLSQIKTKSSSQPYSSSLGKVAQAMKINPSGWHNALADVNMMIQVMKRLIELLKENVPVQDLPEIPNAVWNAAVLAVKKYSKSPTLDKIECNDVKSALENFKKENGRSGEIPFKIFTQLSISDQEKFCKIVSKIISTDISPYQGVQAKRLRNMP